ncbi:hypothetical protein NOK12_16270 [Nocardioides sp. OK12]|uniref:SAF domain-containing protein n=1 Tax=Nocardioides sp. OK12 TaxID=2758661 RepID=UPI0021C482F1|nr:SAF domain-containing protein [Nocardioides sp. OK12]GHJ59109.1 hypothetical protein NOK12_16270 [Nocardioides sp. OK12]
MLSADPRHPDPPLTRLRRAAHGVRRSLLARRRPLAALLSAVAVLAGLHVTTQPPPATVPVLVAARDLPGGAVLGPGDLVTVDFSPASVPEGLAEAPLGEVLAAPLARGEVVSRARLVGPGLAQSAPSGVAALPVRLPDPEAVALLRVGDRIDLVATDPAEGGSRVVALDVAVLALPPPDGAPGSAASGLSGRVVVLGVPAPVVTTISEAAARSFLSYAWAR